MTKSILYIVFWINIKFYSNKRFRKIQSISKSNKMVKYGLDDFDKDIIKIERKNLGGKTKKMTYNQFMI